MKKLVFIDNDDSVRASEDVDTVKDILEVMGELPVEDVQNIEIIADFRRLDVTKQGEILFNTNHVICTWSMYTATHFNSLGQTARFLRSAGEFDIEGVFYLDCSGNLPEAINRIIKNPETKGVLNMFKAIQDNYLITFADGKPYRIEFNKFSDDELFKLTEVVMLHALLS